MICYAFIGIQGSGKGTQAEIVSKEIDFQHINIGNLLRYNVNAKTELGKLVQDVINRGELVSDRMVFDLIRHSTRSDTKGIIFDGFPRTLAQAEYLTANYDLQKVFFLELSEKDAVERISARRICPSCHLNYNLISQPPKEENRCDVCLIELTLRQDDMPEVIRRRFEEFNQQTQPLRNYFDQQKLLCSINANDSIDKICMEILTEIRTSQK